MIAKGFCCCCCCNYNFYGNTWRDFCGVFLDGTDLGGGLFLFASISLWKAFLCFFWLWGKSNQNVLHQKPGRYASVSSGGHFWYTKIFSHICFPLKASLSLNNTSKCDISASNIQSQLVVIASAVLPCWQTVGLGRKLFTYYKYSFCYHFL